MRKILITMITLILIVTVPLQAMATNGDTFVVDSDANEQQFGIMYTHTDFIKAGLSISGGTAECSGSVQPIVGYSASIRVVLYRSLDGSSWTEIASWSDSADASDTASAGGSKSISSGYQYKVTSFGTVKNSGGTTVESTTKTSAIKSY